jgi:hypothetical protein
MSTFGFNRVADAEVDQIIRLGVARSLGLEWIRRAVAVLAFERENATRCDAIKPAKAGRPPAAVSESMLTSRTQRILEACNGKGATRKQLTETLCLPGITVYRLVASMCEEGVLRGEKRGGQIHFFDNNTHQAT